MRFESLSDKEMKERHGFTPPKPPTSEQMPGQMVLPGFKGRPRGIITPSHPEFHQENNHHVWGSLVGHHNPFLHGGFHNDYDAESSWGLDGWNDRNNHLYDSLAGHLQRQVNKAHPCIGIDGHNLAKVLSSGRLKNQHETQTSGGALSPVSRRQSEGMHFGYPHHHGDPNGDDDDYFNEEMPDQQAGDHPAHALPIYGFLAHDPVKNLNAQQYGDHTLVLHKPKLWHRTSAMFGDSLGERTRQMPSPVQKMHQASAYPGWTHGDWPDEDLHRRLTEAHGEKIDNPRMGYVEAQYHGGVSKHDIHYAILRKGGHRSFPLSAVKGHLDHHGIPWIEAANSGYESSMDTSKPLDSSRHFARRAVQYQETCIRAREGATMYPKVIAERGADSGIYLIALDEHQGQIADTGPGRLWPVNKIQSILARGYWYECDDVDVEDVLALVKPV